MKHHQFFYDLDWNSLLRQKAEFIPQLESEDDTSYFDTRSERYHHLETEEEDTNDEDFNVELRQFSSCSHRFSKVYSSLDLSRGQLEEKGETEEKKSDSPLTVDSLSWTPDFTEMPSLSHSSDIESPILAPRPHSSQLPKFAISAESEEADESSALEDSSKIAFSLGEPDQDEPDATSPGSTHSGATLSGSFSEHLDQLPSRGECGADCSSFKPPSDLGVPSTTPQPDPGPGKQGAIAKVPKSVSAGALSLMIPGDVFGVSPLASPISPYSLSSDPSSRDSSPSRDSALCVVSPKLPVIIHSSGKKFGFTLRAIRVYACDSDVYTVYHMVWNVEDSGPAQKAGLRAGDLITHVNGESVHGLVHTEVVELLLKSGSKVAISTTPFENTSIKTGPARRNSYRSKMIRRTKKPKKEKTQERRRSVFRRFAMQPSPLLHTSRSFTSLNRSLSSGESLPGSPTHSLSPRSPTAAFRPAPDFNQSGGNSSQSSSPSSSAPNSPAGSGHIRPSTLHGLGPKLTGQRLRQGRRKSAGSIPLSPLARTPSPTPQPTSPQRSPSPLLSSHTVCLSKTNQAFPTKMHSPPTIVRHMVRPKSAEPPRSPLLKRVQSEEKLSPSYTGDKKHLCARKHSLEVTQEESQGEEVHPGERDHHALHSVEETPSEAPAVTRVRPAEQGCLKRPVSRKVGRQESVEELDKEKLKAKVVVMRQDWSERRESLQKQEALLQQDTDLTSSHSGEEKDKGMAGRCNPARPQGSPEPGPPEAKAATSTLKDVLYKKLNTRAACEGLVEPLGGGSFDSTSHHGEGLARSPLCSIHPDWGLSRQGKEPGKPERLDFKAGSVEFARKRQSFDDRDECMCRLSPGLHESLHFGSTRSKSLQLDSALVLDHLKGGMGSVHSSPEGLAPKMFSGRGESAVEKLQLISSSSEGPLRKTSSEYKLEGRLVSSLKPLEGTLDIGLLSGPRASKTDTCLAKMADNSHDTVASPPPVWLQSPTERFVVSTPQIKPADKPKPLLLSPSTPRAPASLCAPVPPKEPSGSFSGEAKCSSSGEKPLGRSSLSDFPPKAVPKQEPSALDVSAKQTESRSGVKSGSSSLSTDHRSSSRLFSCGSTPSIREVSNEDQEDEAELVVNTAAILSPDDSSNDVITFSAQAGISFEKATATTTSTPAPTHAPTATTLSRPVQTPLATETLATVASAAKSSQGSTPGLSSPQGAEKHKPAFTHSASSPLTTLRKTTGNMVSVHFFLEDPPHLSKQQLVFSSPSPQSSEPSTPTGTLSPGSCVSILQGGHLLEKPISTEKIQPRGSALKEAADSSSELSERRVRTRDSSPKAGKNRDLSPKAERKDGVRNRDLSPKAELKEGSRIRDSSPKAGLKRSVSPRNVNTTTTKTEGSVKSEEGRADMPCQAVISSSTPSVVISTSSIDKPTSPKTRSSNEWTAQQPVPMDHPVDKAPVREAIEAGSERQMADANVNEIILVHTVKPTPATTTSCVSNAKNRSRSELKMSTSPTRSETQRYEGKTATPVSSCAAKVSLESKQKEQHQGYVPVLSPLVKAHHDSKQKEPSVKSPVQIRVQRSSVESKPKSPPVRQSSASTPPRQSLDPRQKETAPKTLSSSSPPSKTLLSSSPPPKILTSSSPPPKTHSSSPPKPSYSPPSKTLLSSSTPPKTVSSSSPPPKTLSSPSPPPKMSSSPPPENLSPSCSPSKSLSSTSPPAQKEPLPRDGAHTQTNPPPRSNSSLQASPTLKQPGPPSTPSTTVVRREVLQFNVGSPSGLLGSGKTQESVASRAGPKMDPHRSLAGMDVTGPVVTTTITTTTSPPKLGVAEARASNLEKQTASVRKEPADRKKKEACPEGPSGVKTMRREASRAGSSAVKDTTSLEKDSSHSRQKELSPRSSKKK